MTTIPRPPQQLHGAGNSRDDGYKRINKLALSEGEKRPTSNSDADQWQLGTRQRVR